MSATPEPPPEAPGQPPPPAAMAEVAERIERLEDAVAALCNTENLEERIADRIAQKLTQHDFQLPPPTQTSTHSASEPVRLQATPLYKDGAPPVAKFVEFVLPPVAP